MMKNQKKLLFLIYLYTKDKENKWLREEAIIGLVYYFIKKGVFKYPYSYVPTPYFWNGYFKYINYSHEAMHDLEKFIKNKICFEVISPKKETHGFIKGYRTNQKIDEDFSKEFEELFDDNGNLKNIKILDSGILIGKEFVNLTEKDKFDYEVDIDEI